MARRTEQRRAAIWALYQSDLLGRPLDDTLRGDVHGFTRALAAEVRDHQAELDLLISRHATGWTLGRIAPLERAILRVALLEMTRPGELPGEHRIAPEGAIDEAVQTTKEFCGADAPAFVDGVLGAVLRELRPAGGDCQESPDPAVDDARAEPAPAHGAAANSAGGAL